MVFSSAIFIFAFLPTFIGLYYLCPSRWRSVLIIIASYAFYGWWRIEYLLVVIGISLISYVAGDLAVRASGSSARKWAVRIGVGLDLLVLCYFKYTLFFLETFGNLGEVFRASPFPAVEIVLPIGISFLTFQSISYIVDVARRDAPPARNLADFLAFSALFPQLIAGPVLRYKDLSEQLVSREHSVEKFAQGVARFIAGLSMKLLVADTVAPLADRMFALSSPSMAEAWLGAVAYSIQLFFDFAGYSAMAIGLGLMIGFRFVENFNAPYVSHSITEFWRRWHISLSNWLRDYLYVPLGGNRHGTFRTYRNLMLTMVLGGFWHGANWTFVLWGTWHGGFLALERAMGAKSRGSVWPQYLGWIVTTCVVIVGWVMFRAATVSDAMRMYAGMLGQNGLPLAASSAYLNQPIEYFALVFGGILSIGAGGICKMLRWNTSSVRLIRSVILFALCFMTISARTHSPFLYFQF